MENVYKIGCFSDSPLSLPGWIQWNEKKWGLYAETVLYNKQNKKYPYLKGIVYKDKSGRITLPPLNPYLPFEFADIRIGNDGLYADYQYVMELFIEDLKKHGIKDKLILPPGFIDTRYFIWNGFAVDVRYTFLQYFTKMSGCAKHIRKNINKAERAGYTVDISYDWDKIVYCLAGTENKKHFSYNITSADIKNCAELLENDIVRGYLVKDKDGLPVSGGVRLVKKGGGVIDWVQGTIASHLKNGVNQLLYDFVLTHAKEDECRYFDWCGANIPSVALAKSAWGGTLTPYIMIMEKSLHRVLYNYYKPIVKKICGKT